MYIKKFGVIVKYHVCEAGNLKRFHIMVNSYLDKGWKLHGPMTTQVKEVFDLDGFSCGNITMYQQTVILEDDNA
jgi:hypothetical protein